MITIIIIIKIILFGTRTFPNRQSNYKIMYSLHSLKHYASYAADVEILFSDDV